MINASQEFQNIVNSLTRDFSFELRLSNNTVLTDAELINEFQIDYTGASQERLTVGEFCKSSMTFKVIDTGVSYDGLSYTLIIKANGASDEINLGKFWINEVKNEQGGKVLTITAYDLPPFFSQLANPSSTNVQNILTEIETLSGMTINGKSNLTLTTIEGVGASDTWQMLLGYIAGIDGYNVRTQGGNLYLYKYTNSVLTIDTSIVFEGGLTTKEDVLIRGYDFRGKNGLVLKRGWGYMITYSNPYMLQLPPTDYLNLTYTPMGLIIMGNPLIEVGDVITVTNGNNSYKCLVMKHQLSFDGGLKSAISCYADKDIKEVVPIAPTQRKIGVIEEDVSKVKQHFWVDDDGVHVTQEENQVGDGNNILLDSEGLKIREGETQLASFGEVVTMGQPGTTMINITKEGIQFLDYNNIVVTEINASGVEEDLDWKITDKQYSGKAFKPTTVFYEQLPLNINTTYPITFTIKYEDPTGEYDTDSATFTFTTSTSTTAEIIKQKTVGQQVTLAGFNDFDIEYIESENRIALKITSSSIIVRELITGRTMYQILDNISFIISCKVYGGKATFSFGINNTIEGGYSMAIGQDNVVNGNDSLAQGTGLIVNGDNQLVVGKYNEADTTSAIIVGNGTDDNNRSKSYWIARSSGNSYQQGHFNFTNKGRGVWGKDSTDFRYPFVYDNGTNLWIGASAINTQHHEGLTLISSGYNSTNGDGNDTILISKPNATNTGAVNYEVLHTGYIPLKESTAFTYQNGCSAAATSGGNQPKAYKRAGIVTIKGVIKFSSTAQSAAGSVYIGKVPSGFEPIDTVTFVQTGPGQNKFRMLIYDNGNIQVDRYGIATNIAIPANAWLSISCTYIAKTL